jgi:hypothetical protein
MPDAAGGKGGHGVAKPQAVVHRYVVNQKLLLHDCVEEVSARTLTTGGSSDFEVVGAFVVSLTKHKASPSD